MELIRKSDALHAVLHNTGDAAVAAVQNIKPINQHGELREMLIDEMIDKERKPMRLIDAGALIAKWEAECGGGTNKGTCFGDCFECNFPAAILDVKNAPTIDAVPVVHGEWKHGKEVGKEFYNGYLRPFYEDWHCGNCGVVFEQSGKPKYNYCPNCGAKMDGGKVDADS